MVKSVVAVVLSVLMMMTLTGCIVIEDTQEITSASVKDTTSEYNIEDNSDDTIQVSQNENAEESDVNDESIAVDEKILYDQNGLTIKTIGLQSDIWSSKLMLQIDNTSETDVIVQVLDFTINDLVIEPIFSCEIAAGKKANDAIEVYASDLSTNNISKIMDVEFRFNIFDANSWDTIDDATLVALETSAAGSEEQFFDDSGKTVFDKGGVKIVLKKLEIDGSWLGSELYTYVENNSDKAVDIFLENTSVNGYMIEPIFYCSVPAGKKANDSITFTESDLDANEIEHIDSFEGVFRIVDTDTWEDLFKSGIVTVEFSE